MPGIALHQHRAAGIQQFWDQFKVFVEFMDEQVMHDGQFAVLPIWTHLDLTPTPLRLVGRLPHRGLYQRPVPIRRRPRRGRGV